MRRLGICVLVLTAACASAPVDPPSPEVDQAAEEARQARLHEQSEIWRRQRLEAARADLAGVREMTSADARRIAIARIHAVAPDVLLDLPPEEIAGLAPSVLRVYDIGDALAEGPDTDRTAGGAEEDGRQRRVHRIADLVRDALPAGAWSPDGAFLVVVDSRIVVLQASERIVRVESALDRHASRRPGMLGVRIDLYPDGAILARGLGLRMHPDGRQVSIPPGPADVAASRKGARLASLHLVVPWGRCVGGHVAPGVIAPDGEPGACPDGTPPGLTAAATLLAPAPGGERERLDLEMTWTPGASGAPPAWAPTSRRVEVVVRCDLPTVLVWPVGPGAVIRFSRTDGDVTRPRPAWRRIAPDGTLSPASPPADAP